MDGEDMEKSEGILVPHEKPYQYQEGEYTVTRGSAWSGPGCHLGCGVLLYTDKDDKLVKVEGDPENPFTQGRLCVRCLDMPEVVNHKDRLTYPMKRAREDRGKDKWERISWEEAYDIAETQLNAIKEKYGAESVVFIHGTGRDIAPWQSRLCWSFGSPNYGNVLSGNACYLPRVAGMAATTGSFWVADVAQHFPDRYTSWWGIDTLPCVNELDPGYLDYIIDGPDSVVAHWLRLGADGYRLDVADELPDAFILRLKDRIRQVKPDALLIGEVWEDASNKIAYGQRRRYFIDGALDSVMNYPWRKAILDYCQGWDDGTALRQSVLRIAENYPAGVLNCVMNILGTHDTPRILSLLGGSCDGTKDEQAQRQLSPRQRAQALERLQMAAFLQFMLPGMACIYYGDEAGMEGCGDPFNRRYFPWGAEDATLTAYYRALATL